MDTPSPLTAQEKKKNLFNSHNLFLKKNLKTPIAENTF